RLAVSTICIVSTAGTRTTRGAGLRVSLGADDGIYAIGGGGGPTTTAALEAYDSSTNTWTARTSMSATRYFLAAATGADGRIYARSEERRVGKECRSWWWPYH